MDEDLRVEQLDTGALGGRLAEQALETWVLALGLDPSGPKAQAFPEILARHAAREGYRAFGAFGPDGRLLGFGYGYTGALGQWWDDLVAAAMDQQQRRRWLGDHFEVVELHVRPEHQGRGLGGRLHDVLLDGVPNATALLSTERRETNAMALYRKRGWQVVLDDFRFPGSEVPWNILGLDLPRH